jgi:DNA helicase-2/ATP-dependent DNA helicase PcrA
MAAKAAVTQLSEICGAEKPPTFQQVLDSVAKSNLFDIPEALYPYVDGAAAAEAGPDEDGVSERVLGIRQFLKTPFFQIGYYERYVTERAPFETHQGVKGLEFPRVMVLMDDDEARGFMFSYDKLFGVKERTKTDTDNEKTGKETSIDRTRRLLYVTCSRSVQSLALVAYTSNAAGLNNMATKLKWFEDTEVEQFDG